MNELPEWFKAALDESAFESRFNDGSYANFVAEIDNTVVGYISLKSGFHLYHLFVSSDFQKQGIAKRLWLHCVDNLHIEYCTVRSSLFAVPVYAQFGFCVSGERASKEGIDFQPMEFHRTSN